MNIDYGKHCIDNKDIKGVVNVITGSGYWFIEYVGVVFGINFPNVVKCPGTSWRSYLLI